MYIKNVKTTQESIIIYYPTLYISNQSANQVTIKQTILSGIQSLEKNNTIDLNTDPKFVLTLIKEN